MGKSLTDIISAVRFRGDFRSTVRFPDANLTTEIQAAWSELYELIAETNEGYWDTDATLSTVASQPYISLPGDTWRVRGLDLLTPSGVNNGTDFLELPQVGISERNRYDATPGEPAAYRLTARGADLYPTPDRVYTMRLVYTPSAPVLDTTARQYYNGWEEYVIFGALIRLSLNEERDVSSWQAQLQMQKDRIMRGANQRKAQEPEYIPMREGYSEYDTEFSRDQRWGGW